MNERGAAIDRDDTQWQPPPGRKALVDHVVEQVVPAILRGDCLVGSEVPAAEKLAEGFGVSMTVVLEAMRALRPEGLVPVSQGKRPVVAKVDSSATASMLGLTLGRAGSMENLMQVRWRRTVIGRGVRSGGGEHAAVLKVVRSRDSEAAREAMSRHMKLAERSLKKGLSARSTS